MNARTNARRGLLPMVALIGFVATPALGDEAGLAVLMERMQTYTHKLQLSIEARNQPLVDFYIHELEETAEDVADNIPHYGDAPVGQLTREMLLPAIERLEDTVEAGEWPTSELRFVDVIRACNACHLVTGFEYLRVAPARTNPFAQDFSVIED